MKPLVYILVGSDSDWPIMKEAAECLRSFDIPFEAKVSSAHRTPENSMDLSKNAAAQGVRVIIAGAGGAAHLPGVLAAFTELPVIGVPIAHGALQGQDSLLSIVQMPKGVPVASVAIGGAWNAGLLAVQILSTDSTEFGASLRAKVRQFKLDQKEKVLAKKLSL